MNHDHADAASVPPDEPDAVIGLDELVEAILLPHYDSHSDWTYWHRFVDLACVVFGLEGRTRWLQMAMEDIPSKLLPMEGAMEVPREVGQAYGTIRDIHERLGAARQQMQQLQREFFRGLLLSIDPKIERRTTTVGRLRQLGLPERTYHNWDDY